MSITWLDQLEENLTQKLSAFLRENPYQELLLNHQEQRDLYQSLNEKQQEIQIKAETIREQLIQLVQEVEAWKRRATKARTAGSLALAKKAEKHLDLLIGRGRNLWNELEVLGGHFEANEEQLDLLFKETETEDSSFEKKWSEFDAEQELEKLRRKSDLI